MKKVQQKPKKPKTKIQLKIQSQNVTNNFILTNRTESPRDKPKHKVDRVLQDVKTERQHNQERNGHKNIKGSQHRRVTTDSPKFNFRKKFSEDETGTHTPLGKRVSVTQEGFNKKKSCNSLMLGQNTKIRKKTSEKIKKNASGQLSTTMFQRVLGIIIKDYKEGRLKQKELEQTLLELYDRKERKKSMGKKKKKESSYRTFSNQFLRSAHQSLRSQTYTRKRKMSSDEDIEERVLERQGFVNKIVVKGITTSMFLKEDASVSQLKQADVKVPRREPSFNIHTSNSIREINEEMRMIQAQFTTMMEKSAHWTHEDLMAARIQRAWRRYRTKQILKNIAFCRSNENVFNIVDDQFTDQEVNMEQEVNSPQQQLQKPKEKKEGLQYSPLMPRSGAYQSDQYPQLAKMIMNNLMQQQVGKEECLRNILKYLNLGSQEIVKQNNRPIEVKEVIFEDEEKYSGSDQSQRNGEFQLAESRVKILTSPKKQQNNPDDLFQSALSNQLNSFTNKYSSKDVIQSDYFKGKSILQQNQHLDSSLIFNHSQTLAAQNFKTINIQNIEEGLKSREETLILKKEKEVQDLTQRFFNGKIGKDEYLSEKGKIDKWFKYQSKELKKVKNSLIKSCNEARKILDSGMAKLNNEKSQKMLKCLSDKYIKNNNWAPPSRTGVSDQSKRKLKKVRCEVQQQQDDGQLYEQYSVDPQNKEQKSQQFTIFNKKVVKEQPQQDGNQFTISPKMVRSYQDDDINEYKYEQIQRIIQQDQDGFEQQLVPIESMVHQFSDKFTPSDEVQIQDHELSLINNLVNQCNYKFKYLCNEDKEDIFQFLFLDLVLEMFTEGNKGQNRILKSAEMYISKAKRLRKIAKGIKTNIAAAKEYLGVLSKYIMQGRSGLKNMSHAMGPSAIEMLKYMRDEIVEAEDEEAISSTLVLPIDIFEKVCRLPQLQLKLQRYYQDEEKELNRLSFLRTALNINNKSLFDCLNEMLDHERPYGVWGKPFPWKKALSLQRKWTKADQEKKMRKCLEKTVESCSYLCGILVDKEDSLFGSHRVSEQYVMQIREDRLSKMLANELIQSEQRWIFYDDEQTEILMQVSSFLTKKLIKELIFQIAALTLKI